MEWSSQLFLKCPNRPWILSLTGQIVKGLFSVALLHCERFTKGIVKGGLQSGQLSFEGLP